MNHLAHIFLSGDDDELMIGNFMGDYVKGSSSLLHLPPRVAAGVRLHRAIDHFTDHHPHIKAATHLLRPMHGRYAGVVMDVACDFLLIHHWQAYSSLPLSDFTHHIYEVLRKHRHHLPAPLQRSLPEMIAHNWLMGYGTREGLSFVFGKMARRVDETAQLPLAARQIFAHQAALSQHFNVFFPELQAFVARYCS